MPVLVSLRCAKLREKDFIFVLEIQNAFKFRVFQSDFKHVINFCVAAIDLELCPTQLQNYSDFVGTLLCIKF